MLTLLGAKWLANTPTLIVGGGGGVAGKDLCPGLSEILALLDETYLLISDN